MSQKFKLLKPNPIYTVYYTVRINEVANLMPRAALKAEQLNVHGYMTHTQSGHAVCGELEGSSESLEKMLLWLQKEMPVSDGEAQFKRYPPRSEPKYDDFFCC